MAISFVGAGALAAGTTSPMTVALPAGHTLNDLLLLSMVADATGGASITHADYTEVAAVLETGPTPDIQLTALRRIHDGSESDPSVATSAGASNGFFGFASAFRGVDTTTPLDGVAPVTDTSTGSAGAATTFTPDSITTATADAWVVSLVATQANNALSLQTAQGFTLQAGGTDYHTLTGTDCAFGLATKQIASPGAVTMPTWLANASVNWAAISFVLRPATGGGGASTTVPHRGFPRGLMRGVKK